MWCNKSTYEKSSAFTGFYMRCALFSAPISHGRSCTVRNIPRESDGQKEEQKKSEGSCRTFAKGRSTAKIFPRISEFVGRAKIAPRTRGEKAADPLVSYWWVWTQANGLPTRECPTRRNETRRASTYIQSAQEKRKEKTIYYSGTFPIFICCFSFFIFLFYFFFAFLTSCI